MDFGHGAKHLCEERCEKRLVSDNFWSVVIFSNQLIHKNAAVIIFGLAFGRKIMLFL